MALQPPEGILGDRSTGSSRWEAGSSRGILSLPGKDSDLPFPVFPGSRRDVCCDDFEFSRGRAESGGDPKLNQALWESERYFNCVFA